MVIDFQLIIKCSIDYSIAHKNKICLGIFLTIKWILIDCFGWFSIYNRITNQYYPYGKLKKAIKNQLKKINWNTVFPDRFFSIYNRLNQCFRIMNTWIINWKSTEKNNYQQRIKKSIEIINLIFYLKCTQTNGIIL